MKSIQPFCFSSSPHFALFFSSILIVLSTIFISTAYGGNQTDHDALLMFKSTIIHDPYKSLTSWNSSIHFCDWNGITCEKSHKRVIAIKLESQGLEGSLSPHVGNLSFLRELQLFNNSFQGTIPLELGRLSRLRTLSLVRNKFHGVIPTNLSGCSNLEVLTLAYNNLVGNIPIEISLLSKLTLFTLHYNNLTGEIPTFLGNMTALESFSATGNLFNGSIPNTLGHLKNLRSFYCSHNNLHGTIPRSIYNLSRLSNFSLSSNQLTGSLPLAIGTMLPNLVFLQLRDNQLTGRLPPSLSNCSKLQVLEMSDNSFTGKLTLDFAKLSDIYHITLGGNLYGSGESDDMKFFESLKNCSKLKRLHLNNCNFQGVLPTSIGNFSKQLNILNLQENRLHGYLPPSIGNLVGLTTLSLAKNQFTGEIPSTIGMLQDLQFFTVFDNKFSGSIPDAIGNLSLLIMLDLDTNSLTGHIPSSLGNCHNLLELYLNDNRFSGEIPKQLLQLSSLSIMLNLSRNYLFGSLPSEVGDLKMLNYLDLSFNNLSGSIPSSVGECTSLLFLSLKGNLFHGTIPPSLSSLIGLQVLDLSQNNISGNIPTFLERFSFELLNLSFNNLEGEVPTKGVFANASAFSIVGNGKLCGGLVELGLPKCKEEKKKHKRKFPLFLIVLLTVSSLLFILLVGYAMFKKKRKSQLTSQSSMNERLLKVSYSQLLKATNGFSISNLIGEGAYSSIYKGMLDGEDRFVAVKVLRLQNHGAHKSFLAECEAWRSIRHRNLLKIITSCSGVDFQGNDFKALVYEYMPNGSLHDWLHSSAHSSKLNIFQRIHILIDIANALDYLHNHRQTTIVHGDLKPQNVLLDNDMVAHVGDFGLARFIGLDSNQNNSTGFKGTIGYAPPEYGLGNEMTCSGDVYSFGILLLEVMTGKKPTDCTFNEGLNLHNLASKALPDHIIDVIDVDLLKANANQMKECLASTVKIGVACSMDLPTERMNINDALHELQHILNTLKNI